MKTTMEARLARMESQLDSLQQLVEERLSRLSPREPRQKPGWQAIVGTFADDPLYDEAMQLGKEWRDSEHVSQDDSSVTTP